MQALFFVNFKCAYEQKYYLRKTTCVHMRICPYDDMQKYIRRGGEYASARLHVCVDWRLVVFDDLIAFETKIIFVLLRVPDDRLRALCF